MQYAVCWTGCTVHPSGRARPSRGTESVQSGCMPADTTIPKVTTYVAGVMTMLISRLFPVDQASLFLVRQALGRVRTPAFGDVRQALGPL